MISIFRHWPLAIPIDSQDPEANHPSDLVANMRVHWAWRQRAVHMCGAIVPAEKLLQAPMGLSARRHGRLLLLLAAVMAALLLVYNSLFHMSPVSARQMLWLLHQCLCKLANM